MLSNISTTDNTLSFRNDIQALRGIAVLLVVFYHFNLPNLHSGFLGVDIFFVISGYLITKIILKKIDDGSFSFRNFYYRRAKRLLPSAYIVLIATVILSPYFLNESEIQELHAQVIGAITLVSNIVLWGQTDYFAVAAESKALLHFWSLSIEEQYYLLLPALLFFINRKYIPKILITIGIISVISCIFIFDVSTSFYMLPTRMWEFIIGSLGAFVPAKYIGNTVLSFMRIPALITLLIIPFLPIQSRHPGLAASIVCLATIVILIGHNNSKIETSIPVNIIAWVGNFSYSLYLVHWPVIVFTRSAWLGEPSTHAVIFGLLISFFLSYVLFRTVEMPLRNLDNAMSAKLVGILISLSILILITPSAVNSLNKSEINFTELSKRNYGIHRKCSYGLQEPFIAVTDQCRTKKNAKIIIWGDSYAMAWATALMESYKDIGLEQATMSACDPLANMARFPKVDHVRYNKNYAKHCLEFNSSVLNYIINSTNIETVILAGRYQTVLSPNNIMLVKRNGELIELETNISNVSNGIIDAVNILRTAQKKVVLLAPPPANGKNIGNCLERKMLNKFSFGDFSKCTLKTSDVIKYRENTNKLLEHSSKLANINIVNSFDILCTVDTCATDIEGIPLYRDSGHLSVNGAKQFGSSSNLAQLLLDNAD